MKTSFKLLIILLALPISLIGQEINFSQITRGANSFKDFLYQNDSYFSGGNSTTPYFQGKYNGIYIKFYESTGPYAIIDFESRSEFVKLIREIQRRAVFRFKFCTDYYDQVTYNYEASGNIKIRFNLNENRISVEYPSKLNQFMDSNMDILTAFVCTSRNAYAYHTNLKCEGLQNCNSDIAKTNIREAKSYRYRMCEICSDDDY